MILNAGTKVGSHRVTAERLAERHDGGGKEGRHHQRQRDLEHDVLLACALDQRHFLQLRIDGPKRAGQHNVGEGIIMQGKHTDHGKGPVGDPVRDMPAHPVQNAGRTAERVAENRKPGLGFAPGRHHVGDDDQEGKHFFAGNVTADHQPGQDGAQRHSHQAGTDRDHQ